MVIEGLSVLFFVFFFTSCKDMVSVSRKMFAADCSLYLSLLISSTKALPEAPDTLPAWEYNDSVIVIGLIAHLRTRCCRVQNPKIPIFSRTEYTPKNWTRNQDLNHSSMLPPNITILSLCIKPCALLVDCHSKPHGYSSAFPCCHRVL